MRISDWSSDVCSSDLVGRQCNQQTFYSRTGNGNQIFVGNTFRAHELGLQALLASLAQQQAQFSVVTAKVDQVGIQRLELGDDSRVIVVAYVDALEKGNISTAFGEVVAQIGRAHV